MYLLSCLTVSRVPIYCFQDVPRLEEHPPAWVAVGVPHHFLDSILFRI